MKKLFIIGFAVLYAALAFADITPLPDPPQRTDPANFATKADAFLGALPTFATEANTLATTVNGYKTDAEAAEAVAISSAATAQSSANFKGSWPDQTGAAAIPYSVYHEGNYWQLVTGLADVTASEPGVTAAWKVIGGVILADDLDQLQGFSVVNGAAVYLKGRTTAGDGGQGVFVGKSGNFTSEVTADTLSGIYAPSDADSDGSEGCWVRQLNGHVNTKWFGASPLNENNRSEIQGAMDVAYLLNKSVYSENGTYLLKPETTLGRILLIRGPGVKFIGESEQGAILKVASTDEDGNVLHDAGGTTNPAGYVGIFTPTIGNDDVSGFTLRNLTLDLNAGENHLVNGYGNLPTQEPLEGIYPGSSEIYLARFRAGVYILVGDDVTFENVTVRDPQRVGLFCDGSSIYGDIKRATATNCRVGITVSNPGTNDWDVTGILLIGDSCACLNSTFTNTAAGTDYYLARTAMEITGPGARVEGNYANRWHRIALIGNSAYDSIANTIVCTGNVGLNVQRSIQLLARAGAVITTGEPGVGMNVSNNSASFSLTMALNTPLSGDLTGIGMHEIESLGLDSISICNNTHVFPPGATFGGAGIHLSPIGSGTQNLFNITIIGNKTINPPTNGVQVSFADTVENLIVSNNDTTNPGQVSGASDREKSGVLIRGLVKRSCVNGNKTFDDRGTHVTTANVWFTPSAGSVDAETLDNSMFFADGVYDVPIVEVENTNLSPLITGAVNTFVAPTGYAANGSVVKEISTNLSYYLAVNDLWYPKITEGLPVALVTFTDLDTTPSVKGMSWARVNNTGVTSITDFDDAYEGQKLTLYYSTGNTTIVHGANIVTKTGVNVTPSASSVMDFLHVNGVWYEK